MYCPECGRKIEEDMQFCPGCGTAIGEPSSEEHPVTAPTADVDLSRFFSRKMIGLAVAVGVLVAFVGAVACTVADGSDGRKAGLVIYNLGGFVLGGALLLGPLVNDGCDRLLRAGMLVAGALVVGLVLSPAAVGIPW